MVKAQFKIQQTSIMLLAVIFLILLVAIFFLIFQTRNLRIAAVNAEENKQVLMASFISGSSEFSCKNQQFCVDTDKLMVLKNYSMYKDFWTVTSIRVKKIYPVEPEIVCNLGNYPNCNTYDIYQKKVTNENRVGRFVALCRYEVLEKYPVRKCDIGMILIGYDVK